MLVREIAELLNAEVQTGETALDRPVSTAYVGDLYSAAMTKIEKGACWVTVRAHINALAIASLRGAGCVVVTEGGYFPPEAVERAKEENIALLTVSETSYAAARKLALAGLE